MTIAGAILLIAALAGLILGPILIRRAIRSRRATRAVVVEERGGPGQPPSYF